LTISLFSLPPLSDEEEEDWRGKGEREREIGSVVGDEVAVAAGTISCAELAVRKPTALILLDTLFLA
jgi:hypothetical protein